MTRSQFAWILTAIVGLAMLAGSDAAAWPLLHTICRSACHSGQPDVATARTLHAVGISLNTFATLSVARDVLLTVIWFGVGGLIILHRPRNRGPVVAAFFLLLFAMNLSNAVAVPSVLQPIVALTNIMSGVAIVLFGFLFPDGSFVPRWMRWIAVAVIVSTVIDAVPPSAIAPTMPGALQDFLSFVAVAPWIVTIFAILASQVYRYRVVSSKPQRQQVKWVLYGLAVSLCGILLLNLGTVVIPGAARQGSLYDVASYTTFPIFTTTIPISIGIAMLRSRLWDVDRVISRTLVYGSVTLSLAALYIGGVIALQSAFRAISGQSSDLAVAMVTLVVAALFNPWRRRLQTFIDQRFYRRRYDATVTLAAFNRKLRDEVDLDRLAADVVAVTQETVQPAHIALWIRGAE